MYKPFGYKQCTCIGGWNLFRHLLFSALQVISVKYVALICMGSSDCIWYLSSFYGISSSSKV